MCTEIAEKILAFITAISAHAKDVSVPRSQTLVNRRDEKHSWMFELFELYSRYAIRITVETH